MLSMQKLNVSHKRVENERFRPISRHRMHDHGFSIRRRDSESNLLGGADDLYRDFVAVLRGNTVARRARKRVTIQTTIDATPERLAKGDDSAFVNPAEIDSAEQNISLTRRFTLSHIDRLYRNEKLTWEQWYSADWYRTQYFMGAIGARVTGAYEPRTSGGEPSYGMPTTERQAAARRKWRTARDHIPPHMLGYIDRLVIHDELPRYAGRANARSIKQLADALDVLAFHILRPANS